MRTLLALLLLTIATGAVVIESLPGRASAEVVAPRTRQVRSIAIAGAELPLARLRQTLGTRIGAEVDTLQLERDRRAMQAYLEARGYLAARVDSPTVTFGAHGAYVVFDVERGPLYRVRSVTLDGPAWDDAGVVTLARGDEAVAQRFAQARRAAEATLARHGRSLVVDLVVRADRTEPLVDVTLATR